MGGKLEWLKDLVGKRYMLFGLQDSGKTTLAKYIAKNLPGNEFIYDIMGEYQVGKDFNGYQANFTGGEEAIVEFQETLNEFVLPNCKKGKIQLLMIDEINRLHNKYLLEGPLLELNDSTAHFKMAMGAIARRPTQVHTDLVDLAHYLFIFHLDGMRTTNYLENVKEGLGEMAKTLQPFEFIVYNKGSPDLKKYGPIPISGFSTKKGPPGVG